MGLACLRSRQTWNNHLKYDSSYVISYAALVCNQTYTKEANKLLERSWGVTSFERAEGAEIPHQAQQVVSCSCENVPGNRTGCSYTNVYLDMRKSTMSKGKFTWEVFLAGAWTGWSQGGMKCRASYLQWGCTVPGKKYTIKIGKRETWKIFDSWSRSESPAKKGTRSNSSAKIHPTAQISTPTWE